MYVCILSFAINFPLRDIIAMSRLPIHIHMYNTAGACIYIHFIKCIVKIFKPIEDGKMVRGTYWHFIIYGTMPTKRFFISSRLRTVEEFLICRRV